MKSLGKELAKINVPEKKSVSKAKVEELKTEQIKSKNSVIILGNAFDGISSAFTSFLGYLNEKEITKRAQIEAETETNKMKLRYYEIVSEEKRDFERMKNEYETKMAGINNETKKIEIQGDIISRMIASINNYENTLNEYKENFGIASPEVMGMFDRLDILNKQLTELI